jgi:hypothetical protein
MFLWSMDRSPAHHLALSTTAARSADGDEESVLTCADLRLRHGHAVVGRHGVGVVDGEAGAAGRHSHVAVLILVAASPMHQLTMLHPFTCRHPATTPPARVVASLMHLLRFSSLPIAHPALTRPAQLPSHSRARLAV